MKPLSRVCSSVASVGSSSLKQASPHFKTPTKPRPYGQLLPAGVEYAPPGKLTIQEVLPHILDKSKLRNTLVLLRDLDNPEYPSFLITTLRSRFFPRGTWSASLYTNHYPDPEDYRLAGSLTVSFEPRQLPYWLTWRFLSRHIRARASIPTNRNLRQPSGLLIDPDLQTIVPLGGEAG